MIAGTAIAILCQSRAVGSPQGLHGCTGCGATFQANPTLDQTVQSCPGALIRLALYVRANDGVCSPITGGGCTPSDCTFVSTLKYASQGCDSMDIVRFSVDDIGHFPDTGGALTTVRSEVDVHTTASCGGHSTFYYTATCQDCSNPQAVDVGFDYQCSTCVYQ